MPGPIDFPTLQLRKTERVEIALELCQFTKPTHTHEDVLAQLVYPLRREAQAFTKCEGVKRRNEGMALLVLDDRDGSLDGICEGTHNPEDAKARQFQRS